MVASSDVAHNARDDCFRLVKMGMCRIFENLFHNAGVCSLGRELSLLKELAWAAQ